MTGTRDRVCRSSRAGFMVHELHCSRTGLPTNCTARSRTGLLTNWIAHTKRTAHEMALARGFGLLARGFRVTDAGTQVLARFFWHGRAGSESLGRWPGGFTRRGFAQRGVCLTCTRRGVLDVGVSTRVSRPWFSSTWGSLNVGLSTWVQLDVGVARCGLLDV